MISVDLPDLRRAAYELEGELAAEATAAMHVVAAEAKAKLRRQIAAAGFGDRLARTWNDKVYPQSRRSLRPAGYVYSNAPDIIDAFDRGATIRPLAGRRYLFIPTRDVPRHSRRNKKKRMTWEEVEAEFGAALIFLKGKAGRLLAFVDRSAIGKPKGVRKGARRSAKVRDAKLVLMFTLVPVVKLPKKLDLDRVAQEGAARFANLFAGARR